MAVATITDVITALDAVIQQAHDNASRVGYFAALYRRVTWAVRDGIVNGAFQNGPRMERLDVAFASRYLDALATFQAGGMATKSWMVAFQACSDANLLILQHLVAGINAHINLDLGIAAAQVSPPGQLQQLKPDFDHINTVLASLVSTVATEIAAVSPRIGDLEQIGLRTGTSFINFDMTLARDAAWLTAERLAAEPEFMHDATIDVLDLGVSIRGSTILYPLIGGNSLQLIQQAETKDVRRVIEILAEPAAATAAAAS